MFINTIMRTQTLTRPVLFAFILFVLCMECVLFIIGIRQKWGRVRGTHAVKKLGLDRIEVLCRTSMLFK